MIRSAFSFCLVLAACLPTALLPVAAFSAEPRIRSNFDAGWSFTKGNLKGAERADFDHSAWRQLDLPHDWSVEGPFDAANPSGAPGAYLPTGNGWYRKAFHIPAGIEGRKVFVEFDGVYMNSEVWINGHPLGKRPYGYLGFEYDLTPHLKFGGRNVIAVRVDNTLQPSARWYSGTGIYRHVWMKITDPVHVAHWGTYVTTPEITAERALVAIETTIRNHHADGREVVVKQSVLDPSQAVVATTESTIEVPAGGAGIAQQQLTVGNPARWSPETPNLYTVRTELRVGDRVTDVCDSPLGIRTIRFDREKGIFLNDQPIIMQGMCNHQDLGPLGSALWDRALERRMKMLKEMGVNALRTAHYPHSPEFMRLADEMGFLVVNETFDEWRRGWNFEDGQLVSSKEDRGKARNGYN
ncbi:MAG: sugar-binding domain-containing protein, partial [Luteolibacter sp.]